MDRNQLKQILEQIFLEKLYTCFVGESVFPMVMEVLAYAQQIVHDLENTGQSPPVSCRSGCSFCCYSHIRIIPIEALLIHSYIQEQFSDDERKELKEKIQWNHRVTQGKSIEEQFILKSETPCVFLRESICRIYPVRPFICRAWNSLDVSECRSAFYAENHHARIESSPARNHVFESARGLFLDLCLELKLETTRLEMSRAVSRCLKTPDPMGLWLAGHGILNPEPAGDEPVTDPGPENGIRTKDNPVSETPMTQELTYVDYFYQKFRGRISLGVGYDQNFSEIYPFIFQNVHGKPIGVIAMGEISHGKKAVHIYHIGSFETRRGNGSHMLRELCRKADCFNIHLSVSPVFMPNGKDARMDYELLAKWYGRFDFKGEATLMRTPRKQRE